MGKMAENEVSDFKTHKLQIDEIWIFANPNRNTHFKLDLRLVAPLVNWWWKRDELGWQILNFWVVRYGVLCSRFSSSSINRTKQYERDCQRSKIPFNFQFTTYISLKRKTNHNFLSFRIDTFSLSAASVQKRLFAFHLNSMFSFWMKKFQYHRNLQRTH